MRDTRSIKMINIQKNNPASLGEFKQRSNATLILNICNEHMNYVDLTNQQISLRMDRPDGGVFEQIEGITKANHILTIKLKNEILECVGKVRCELNLKDNEGQMTSADFNFDVSDTVLDDNMVFSSDDYESLEKALVVFQTKSQAMMDEFDANEKVRINNENTRISQENARRTNETNRTNAESVRVGNENTRKTQENTRSSNETTRQSQEANREKQEDNRQNIFSQKEVERRDTFNRNEASRQSTFQVNEDRREANEATRQNQETARIAKETERNNNENTRKSNETNRTNKFTELETNANKLINQMQTTVDTNIGTEVIESRKGKAKLGLRLDDMETVSANNANKISELENLTPVWQECTGTGNITIQDGFEGIVKDVIIKGKTTGGYNAETGQSEQIVSSGESEGNKLILKSVGKNLCDSLIEIGNIDASGNTLSSKEHFRTASFINLSKNGEYIISLKPSDYIISTVFIYDSNKKFIRYTGHKFTLTGDEKYIKFKGRHNVSGTIITNVNIIVPQVEEGTIASNYEPYVEDKKEILLPFEGGLKDFYNEANDTVNFDLGKATEKVGKYIFKDTDNWTKQIEENSYSRFILPLAGSVKLANRHPILSDRIKSLTTSGVREEKSGFIHNGSLYVYVTGSTTDTIQDVKNLMSGGVLYYKLAEPIVHNIDKMALNQYDGTTHIIQENQVTGDISCKAKVSLSSQNNRLREENKALEAQLSEEQYVQDCKITTTMLANTELFEMVLGMMPMKLNNTRGGDSNMVEVYVTLIIQGDKTLDQVPKIIKSQVEGKLRLLGVIS